MNKKKLLVTLLTLVLVCSMLFGLVACNNNNDTPGNTTPGTGTETDQGSNEEKDPVNPTVPIAPKPIPNDRAVFYFQKDANRAPSMVLIHTDDFANNATIKDVFDLGWYKYDIKASYAGGMLDTVESKGLVPNKREYIQIFTSEKPEVMNEWTNVVKVDSVDFYSASVGMNEIKLKEGVSYLFATTYGDKGALAAEKSFAPVDFNNIKKISEPAIDGNFQYVLEGKEVVKLEKVTEGTGYNAKTTIKEVKRVGLNVPAEVSSSWYALKMPVVVGDKVICTYAGYVQAFNKDTLDSLWVYGAPTNGQSLSEMVIDGTMLYVGFHQGQGKNAKLVCLDITDEQPTVATEEKAEEWSHERVNGYYSASGVVVGKYFVIGGENPVDQGFGAEETPAKGTVDVFNKTTGAFVESKEFVGDNRSGMVYDKTSKSIYFTTNVGKLYRVGFDESLEKPFTSVYLEKALSGTKSTCTPAISGNRLYVTSGGEKNLIEVWNIDDMSTQYTVELGGYSQCKPYVVNEVHNGREEIFVYFTENKDGGGISFIVDNQNAKSSNYYSLYAPAPTGGNYCLSNIVADNDGNMYFVNDDNKMYVYKQYAW